MSAGVPTYNGEESLAAQFESILRPWLVVEALISDAPVPTDARPTP
jgi:hypothetical protein